MSLKKSRKQIENKKAKVARFDKFCTPRKRKFGKYIKKCRKCGKRKGVIHKYNLMYCRQCFREQASGLGFKKYS